MDLNKLVAIDQSEPNGLEVDKNKRPKKWLYISLVLYVFMAVATLVAAVGAYAWYQGQLQAVDPNNIKKQIVIIEPGESTSGVAKTLYDNQLIRSEQIFMVYARLNSFTAQAGAYMVSPSQDLPAIAKKFSTGETDSFDLNISPGLTIEQIKAALVKSGFNSDEVEAAFARDYDIDVLDSRPAGASLEGYIMGFAQKFSVDSKPEDIVRTAIENLDSYIKQHDLERIYKSQGLDLYEALTLASIVQKEVAHPDDMAHVAQVFHLRLKKDMPLGSDPTFIYGARLLGVPPSTDLDSPYNTRIHKGLTPTPIANPSEAVLYALAHPTNTEDLFFVAGDDGKTRFSKTNAEHERLTRKYCHKNCLLPPS